MTVCLFVGNFVPMFVHVMMYGFVEKNSSSSLWCMSLLDHCLDNFLLVGK